MGPARVGTQQIPHRIKSENQSKAAAAKGAIATQPDIWGWMPELLHSSAWDS